MKKSKKTSKIRLQNGTKQKIDILLSLIIGNTSKSYLFKSLHANNIETDIGKPFYVLYNFIRAMQNDTGGAVLKSRQPCSLY